MQTAFVAILAVAAFAQAAELPNFLSEEYIQQINQRATTWKAGRNFPEDTPLSHIKGLLGARKSDQQLLEVKEEDYSLDADSIPESFDARVQWPKCPGIKEIADQSACGSCWAVGATTAISDRICIHSDGAKQTTVSAADLMSCCDDCGDGCDGGYPDEAWNYWVINGLVTGGSQTSGIGCKPYPFAPCAHHVNSTKYPACPDIYSTPTCEHKCSNSSITYSNDLNKGQRAYNVRGVQNIQKEILTNGPVEASFRVYADFTSYKSGVYQKTAWVEYMGGHAVRVIGWGTENGTPYWLVANSWNEGWGDNGTFKIVRGRNECGFESDIVGGIPKY